MLQKISADWPIASCYSNTVAVFPVPDWKSYQTKTIKTMGLSVRWVCDFIPGLRSVTSLVRLMFEVVRVQSLPWHVLKFQVVPERFLRCYLPEGQISDNWNHLANEMLWGLHNFCCWSFIISIKTCPLNLESTTSHWHWEHLQPATHCIYLDIEQLAHQWRTWHWTSVNSAQEGNQLYLMLSCEHSAIRFIVFFLNASCAPVICNDCNPHWPHLYTLGWPGGSNDNVESADVRTAPPM